MKQTLYNSTVMIRFSPNFPQTFTRVHTNGLWTLLHKTFIGYGCLLPEMLVFPTSLIICTTKNVYLGHVSSDFDIYVSHWPEQYEKHFSIHMCTLRLGLVTKATKHPLSAAVVRELTSTLYTLYAHLKNSYSPIEGPTYPELNSLDINKCVA